VSIDAIERRLAAALGNTTTEALGVLQRREFLRYAAAAGDDAYVAATESIPSSEAALAPVMFLPGILHWTSGPHEHDLRGDGLAPRDAPGVEGENVNIMHGGQKIAFHRRAVEGMRVSAHRTTHTAQRKHGRAGDFLVVVTTTEFVDDTGDALATVDDTILVPPR
jgi:hypothetical protein